MAMLRTGSAASISLCAVVMLCLAACSHGASAPPKAVKVAAIASNARSSRPSPITPRQTQQLAVPAGVAAAAATAPIPGDDPAIQRWFLAIDKAKWAYDNALFKAEQVIFSPSPSASSASACQPLVQTVKAILAALPKLRSVSPPAGASIADAVQPLMDTMQQVGAACVSMNFTTARSLLATGIPQQASAQAAIDAILDGD
jgi:hypothetical protein